MNILLKWDASAKPQRRPVAAMVRRRPCGSANSRLHSASRRVRVQSPRPMPAGRHGVRLPYGDAAGGRDARGRQVGFSQMRLDVPRDPQAERHLRRGARHRGVAVLGRQDGTEEFDAGRDDRFRVRALVDLLARGQLGEVGEDEPRDRIAGLRGDRLHVPQQPLGKRRCRTGDPREMVAGTLVEKQRAGGDGLVDGALTGSQHTLAAVPRHQTGPPTSARSGRPPAPRPRGPAVACDGR